MSEEKEKYTIDTDNSGLFEFTPPNWAMSFTNPERDEVGKLEFDDAGDLHFSGNADEAAKVFFSVVVECNNQKNDDMKKLLKMGLEVVEDFLPNVGNCALQDYGRLNEFMIQATKEVGE